MARDATITFEQVAAAADNLKAQGAKATARAVREQLGSGSMATVLKLLQQWQAGQQRQTLVIDDTVHPEIARAISNQIAARVQEATAELTARLGDLQGETALLITENERQAAEIEAQAVQLAALQEQHAALAGRAQQQATDAERTGAELASERQAAESARVALAKAELRLEAMPRIEAEILTLRAELDDSRANAARLHETAAVATARQEAADQARAKAEQQAAELATSAAASTAALQTERVAIQTGQARLEAALRDLEAAKEAARLANATAQASAETAAELRGQLTAHKVTKPAAKVTKPAAKVTK